MKFREIFRFEIYYQFRRPSTWIYFLVVLGLISLVVNEIAEYARTVENVLLNSPLVIAEITGYTNKFALLIVAALAADAGMRDVQARMDPLLYTTSLSKASYLGGRFLGTFFVASVLTVIAVPLGISVASYTQGLESALFANLDPIAYIRSSIFLNVPNVFVATAVLYSIVLFSRQAMAAYGGALLLFLLSTFNLEMVGGNWTLAKLFDPSGITVVNELNRSLTPLQANATEVELKGFLLWNRLTWITTSLVAGILAYARFRLSHYTGGFRLRRANTMKADPTTREQPVTVNIPAVARTFNYKVRIYQTLAFALHYYKGIVMRPVGLTIPAIAFFAFVLIPNLSLGPLSFPILPTTDRVTSFMKHSALQIVVVMLITVFAGQLIWRERDTRLHEIADAVPVPNGLMLLSKYIGLSLVLVTLQAALMAAGIAIQFNGGYDQPDIPGYLRVLFGVQLQQYLLLAAVAMFIHVMVNQKYVAHMVVVLFYLYTILAGKLGIEHKLLIFGSDTGLASSVFYGQSAFMLPWILFKLYWIGWALLLMVVAKQMWVRGRETSFITRLRHAVNGLKRSPLFIGSLVIITSTGSFIFYNTNILNEYTTATERIQQQVDYERLYGKYEAIPQPHIVATKLHIEIYPEKREAVINGIYLLKNSSGKNIDSIHVALAPGVVTSEIKFNRNATSVLTDDKHGHLIYALKQCLLPGDSLQLNYMVRFKPRGFSNSGINTAVMNNGTCLKSSGWLPSIGYQPARELSNNKIRTDHNLAKQQELKSARDTVELLDRSGKEHIRFEVTVGTAANQIAVAPGLLKKTWTKNGRQYFHYFSDNPIRNLYYIYSGNYQVREASWKDKDLKIFHHPKSVLNLDVMEQAMKASLGYYSKSFSPYQYGQLSLVEYPNPGTGGISLAGTVGYSTNFALLNPAEDDRGFDLPFAVVAHEIAHQWWAHQLTPANVEGAPLITESLAWFSALGVIEQEKGPQHVRNLLDAMRQEYLNPRSRAGVPLLQAADGFQAYRKGPFAMYALREYVGEQQVNLALQKLLKKFKPGEPPYATSLDFYAEIQAVTPDSLKYLLNDLFATNTFWELTTKEATLQPTNDGNWLVTMNVFARKVTVDKAGVPTEVPMNDLVEIGVYGDGTQGTETALYLQKQRIRSGANHIEVKVSAKPVEAGIDPRNLLIDTETYNNVKQLKMGKKPVEK